MRKRTVIIIACIFLCLTGYENKKSDEQPLETEKAAEVALEYRNSTYNEEFYLVSSKKDAEHGMYEKETV